MSLEGSKTHENLKAAFAGESQANRRYLYFARAADIEGYPEAAGVFKNTADGETGHAFGHLEFMEKGGAGNRLTALKLICQCLPKDAFGSGLYLKKQHSIWDTCSLIILKNVIDGISNETTMNKLAIKIGTGLMMEARITMFKDQNKEKYNQVNKRLAGKNIPQNANRYQYKHKVWTYMMNKNDLTFNDWGKEGRLHLGVKMIEYLSKLGLIKHQNRKLNKFKTVTFGDLRSFKYG